MNVNKFLIKVNNFSTRTNLEETENSKEKNKELWKHKNIHAHTHVCTPTYTARHSLPYGITALYLADGLSINKFKKNKNEKLNITFLIKISQGFKIEKPF